MIINDTICNGYTCTDDNLIYTINWLGGKTLKICYGFCVISIVINVCEVYCTPCIKDNVKRIGTILKGLQFVY